MVVDPQPSLAALVKPYTRLTRPSVERTAPGTSYRVEPSARLSCTTRTAPTEARTAIGTLTSKHHRHETYSVRMPPSRTPMAPPAPETAP